MAKLIGVVALSAIGMTMIVPYAHAQSTSARSTSAIQSSGGAAPDNSKSNKLDQTNTTATADDQKNDPADLDVTKRIRSSVMADKSLSTYAHNIKIVTANGAVTLNGVVRSQAEKDSIAAKAQSVAGSAVITNNLKIAPPN